MNKGKSKAVTKETQKTKKPPIKNKKAKKSVKKQVVKSKAKKSTKPTTKPTKQAPIKVAKTVKNVKATKPEKNTLKVRFLGGVGEIGKNMTALEYGSDIIVIDAGITFPGSNMPGVDLVIPDTTYLLENQKRIKGIVITHGHEDHIGSLPYILKELNAPIYGTKLTLTLIESKLKEHKINDAILNCVNAGSVIKLGCFSIEFINVNHSIAGAVGLSITTPVGVVFHSGDFKIDFTPVAGDTID